MSGPSGIPGKATLTGALPTTAAAIGDRYIENREHCAPGVDGCFLTDTQRMRLVSAYQSVVGVAQGQYSNALTQIRFDELIKKAAEMPLLLSFALDVLAGQALAGISFVIKALKGASAPQIAADQLGWMLELQGGGDAASNRPSLTTLIAGTSEPALGFVAKAGIDEAKKQIKAPVPSSEKAVTLNYITALEESSMIAFDHQRFDPPGYATDADLIVLFHSYRSLAHSTPRYKAALEEKIDRFLSSSTSRIGRHAAKTQRDFDVQGNTARDTQVVWVRSSGTPVPTLYYYKRDFENSQNEHTMGDVELHMLQPLDSRFKIDRPVETEFVDVAIAKHRAAWGTEPETREIDPKILPRWRPRHDVGDLNQYVPANNPDFRPAGPPAVRDVGDLNQYVPANNPDFKPVADSGSVASPDPVAVRGPRHVK